MESKSGIFGLNLMLTAILLAVNFIFLNSLADGARSLRVDLTEGNRYSLTDATKDLMKDLDGGAEILFYYSSPDRQHELLRPLIDPLKDLLSEFSVASRGNVQTRFIEFEKESKEEQQRAKDSYGVKAYEFEIRSAYEAGVRATYFTVVVSSGRDHEQFDLSTLIDVRAQGDQHMSVELADVENLIATALRKAARGFDSVPGALAARDKHATVTYFATPELFPKHLEGLKDTVVKVCDQMKRESGGRLELHVINPYEGKTPEEYVAIDNALFRQRGVKPIPKDIFGESVFHSWLEIVVDKTKDRLPLYTSGSSLGEADVKSEIEGSLKRLIPGYLPTVALASDDPPFNPMMAQMGQRPPRSEFAFLTQYLSPNYTVSAVKFGGAEGAVPRNAGALVLVRPGDLDDKALYEIDQFLMRGGRLVVCIDSFSFDAAMTGQMRRLSVMKVENKKIADFLGHFGCKVEQKMILDTRCDYLRLPTAAFSDESEDLPYPYMERLTQDAINSKNAITAGLKLRRLFWATPLDTTQVPEGVVATTLLSTSPDATLTDSTAGIESVIQTGYKPKAEDNPRSHAIAVLLEGKFKSYFADKPIPGLDKPAEATPKEAKEGEAPAIPETAAAKAKREQSEMGAPLLETANATSIVVIGDSDFLSQGVFGLPFMNFDRSEIDANVKFLSNAIDYGGPNADLIAVRNRPPARRPLEGLSGLSADDRKASGIGATVWTVILSLGALITVALIWLTWRGSQKPLTIESSEDVMGGLS